MPTGAAVTTDSLVSEAVGNPPGTGRSPARSACDSVRSRCRLVRRCPDRTSCELHQIDTTGASSYCTNEPGSPWENGYIKSFSGELRDELLDGEIFDTLLEAKVLTERWRQEYNTVRPHSSLGYRPPALDARLFSGRPPDLQSMPERRRK